MDVHQWQVHLGNMHTVASSEINSDLGWTSLNYSYSYILRITFVIEITNMNQKSIGYCVRIKQSRGYF